MKVLITADLHVGDYNEYNPTPYFRLKQFLKLSDFIVEQAKLNNASELWIAGDLLQVSRPTPMVMNTLKTFLSNITKSGIIVRAILGNHDVTVRSSETDVSQYPDYSLITLLDIENVYFYLNDIVKIDNRMVHWHSWTPENWFKSENADILVAHGDASKALSNFSSKMIDYQGYKKAFIGHIHKQFNDDIFVSPSVPIAHSYSDDPNTGLVLFDLETYEYSRISTKDDFLKFEYVDNIEQKEELENSNVNENVDAVVRVKPIKDLAKVRNIENLDIYKYLEEYLAKFEDDSKDFIQNALRVSDVNETKPIDLNFKLKTLNAKNFLSIKELNLNFDDFNSLTVIEGAIGAGKSTLFKLLNYMFFGKVQGYVKSSLKSVFAKKNETFEGVLTLMFKGHEYKIQRTFKDFNLYEDGQVIETENISERQKVLENKLSFLEFWNILYISQSSNGIFASMNDGSRVSFLSKFLKLDTVEQFSNSLSACIQDLKDKIKLQDNDIASKTATINTLNEFIAKNKNLKYIDPDELNSKLSEIKDQRNVLHSCIQTYEREKYVFDTMTDNVLKLKKNIVKNNEALKILNAEKQSIENQLSSVHDINANELDDLKGKLALVNSKIGTLNKHKDECPTCHQKWLIPNLDEMFSKLKNAKNILECKISEMSDIHKEYSEAINKLKTVSSKCEQLQHLILKDENELSEIKIPDFSEKDITDIKNQEITLSKEIESLLQEIGAIETKNKIFNDVVCNIEKHKKINEELTSIKSKNVKDKEILKDAENFNSKVLSNKGLLVATLLQDISDKLNVDPKIKVQTISTTQGGKVIPTLNLQLYVDQYKQFIDYDMLSGGQKLVADIRFLACIISLTGRISTLFLDEIFKYLSDTAILEMSELLKELDINTIFITLHGNMQGNISNSILHVSLSENGSTYEKI